MIEFSNGDSDRYPFRFGLKKALIILKFIDEIKKFVEENAEKAVPIMNKLEGDS